MLLVWISSGSTITVDSVLSLAAGLTAPLVEGESRIKGILIGVWWSDCENLCLEAGAGAGAERGVEVEV